MAKRNNSVDEIILGLTDIHGYAHDNSVAILKNGKILFAASEERYSRIKHDSAFPIKTIKAGLNFLKLKDSDISQVAVGYPPRKTVSVFKNRYFYELLPFLVNIFINRNFLLLKDLINATQMIYSKTKQNQSQSFLRNKQVTYIDHYLSHAASAYYTSGLSKSIAIALDGFGPDQNGDIQSGGIFLCSDGQMQKVVSLPIYASLGLFYQSVTFMLGFSPEDGAGKTMGLAAYGDPQKTYLELKQFCPTFENDQFLPPKDWLAPLLTSMPKISHLFRSTSFGKTLKQLLKKYRKEDLAASAQKLLEEEIVNLTSYLLKKYPEYDSFTLSGGVFLNVKANKKIMELKGVKNVFIHPNAPDGGTALGAAFAIENSKYLQQIVGQPLLSAGLGESFTNSQILQVLNQYQAKLIFKKQDDIIQYTVDQLIKKRVIGWFQGRAEWGPRALGFRSVLADPRDPQVKERINHVLKNREWFMPFAPSVLEEEAGDYFKDFHPAPFMTLVFDLLPQKGKLIPAAIHVDDTARVNSVTEANNHLYHRLLKAWYKKTKLPIILNTSFNRHGLPIVNSPKDAVEHLLMGAIDELIIGSYSVKKI